MGAAVAAMAGLVVSATPAAAGGANPYYWECDSTPTQLRVIKASACIMTDGGSAGGGHVARWGVELENTYSVARYVRYTDGREYGPTSKQWSSLRGYEQPAARTIRVPAKSKIFFELGNDFGMGRLEKHCFKAWGIVAYGTIQSFDVTSTYTCEYRSGDR
jgi:hypothetical protein